MVKYRLIVFDFDGTLADSFPWFARTLNEVADQYGFQRLDPGNLELVRRMGPAALLRYLRIPRWKVPLIAMRMRQLMARDIGDIRRFDGVDRTLAELHRQGAALGLVTSNSLENVRQVLGAENLDLIPQRECGVGMFGKAASLRKVLARCGVSRDQTILIGDEIRDAEAARSAGIAFGAATWGYTHTEALAACQPQELFPALEDIPKMAGRG